jgi:uncharacterized protein YoxC
MDLSGKLAKLDQLIANVNATKQALDQVQTETGKAIDDARTKLRRAEADAAAKVGTANQTYQSTLADFNALRKEIQDDLNQIGPADDGRVRQS